jgi:hypothetical protein
MLGVTTETVYRAMSNFKLPEFCAKSTTAYSSVTLSQSENWRMQGDASRSDSHTHGEVALNLLTSTFKKNFIEYIS